ncbi:hypothetical protein [Escherichia coli]|uniref:hypothetical protein n=1 Tax=Escherichia coli TaxID=562 RepID=UPI001FCF1893|nr:hypothetical protein [Escherichia coli]
MIDTGLRLDDGALLYRLQVRFFNIGYCGMAQYLLISDLNQLLAFKAGIAL